jgi:hypothetical protein
MSFKLRNCDRIDEIEISGAVDGGAICTHGGGRLKKEHPHRQSAAARHFFKTALISRVHSRAAVAVPVMMSKLRVNKVLVAINRFDELEVGSGGFRGSFPPILYKCHVTFPRVG